MNFVEKRVFVRDIEVKLCGGGGGLTEGEIRLLIEDIIGNVCWAFCEL